MTTSKSKDTPAAVPAPAQKIVGPVDETELLGCQAGETEMAETEFIEYAVTAGGGLRLREEPNLTAPVVAVLPCGVGVSGNSRPDENGWRLVFTGRLFGWAMDKYLEPLPPLDLSHDAE